MSTSAKAATPQQHPLPHLPIRSRPPIVIPTENKHNRPQAALPSVGVTKANPKQTTTPTTKTHATRLTALPELKTNNTKSTLAPTLTANTRERTTVLPQITKTVNTQPTSTPNIIKTNNTNNSNKGLNLKSSDPWIDFYPSVKPPITISQL